MAEHLKVASLNVRGLHNSNKRNVIYRWIKENRYDICCLQETYCTKPNNDKFKKGWSGEIYHSFSNSTHSRGVCILLNKKLNVHIVSSASDKCGRIVLLNIEIDKLEYSILSIYAPNAVHERIVFFEQLCAFVDTHALNMNRIIIAGDFNCTLGNDDRIHVKVDRSTSSLNDVMVRFNLIDLWRFVNPSSKEFTYIDPSCNMRNSRIDLLLCSDTFKSECTESVICQAPTPDHKAVSMVITQRLKERGKGYWKLNNSFLDHKDYQLGITSVYEEVITEYGQHVCNTILWEYFKLRVKQFSIEYGIAQAQLFKDKCKDLESKLDQLDKKLTDTLDDSVLNERKVVKEQLNEAYHSKSKGYQIRSRAKWVEEGEKSTKYFLNLEKSRQASNCINSLKDCNGKYKHSDIDILRIAKNFYSELYEDKSVNDQYVNDFFETIVPENTLDENVMQTCEGLFSREECFNAVEHMKKNKSPGLDGISREFYEKFWPLIGDLLVNVFNDSYSNGVLPSSQKTSVFSLIFKKGDTCDISNYRPISLTNVDYRIMAFVLAGRLKLVINSIVNQDQTAYIKNRYMGNNIRLIEDIIEHYDKVQAEGLLLTIDFQKAFDSLQWNFMFKTLDFFNFGPSFKQWIKTLYTLPVGKIKNNGYLSDEFSISRGIRQGCPVSALLFILSIEVLGLQVRQDKDIKGFDLGFPDKPIKTIQYADDCVLLINDENELCKTLSVLDKFGKISGLNLNLSKCEGLWLGKNKNNQHQCNLFGLKWPEQLRYLGIYVGHSKDGNIKVNWIQKLEKIEHILNKWKKRDISLLGKIQIIKTFVISQFVLPATILIVPPGIIQKIETMLYRFIWGSRDKVKRKIIIRELKHGGLNMLDIKSLFLSFKANWILKLLKSNPNSHGWAQLAFYNLQRYIDSDAKMIFNFDNKTYFPELTNLSPFYRDVLLSYNRAFVTDETYFKDNIKDQSLWGNKFIVIRQNNRNMVLFLRNWIRSGVNKVRDLSFIDGKLDETFVYQNVQNKSNILAEILLVKQALLPYRELLQSIDASAPIQEQNNFQPQKSKHFYLEYRDTITIDLPITTKYLAQYNDTNDLSYVFVKKVVLEKETKMKEFNFKLLHGILPCNKNLKQWKIKTCDECDVCKQPQTIEHLLLNCRYVKPLWDVVENLFNLDVTFEKILGTLDCCQQDHILTMISFLIYKEWLLYSLDNKSRSNKINLSFYKEELKLRFNIYQLCLNYIPTDIAYMDMLVCNLP